jgi:opine dehydrogenase
MTPAVGAVMEAVDGERLAIADAFGVQAKSLARHFCEERTKTKEAIRSGSAYRIVKESQSSQRIKAPSTLDHRFLHEDVGCGLVPMSAFGNLVGVETPNMEALTRLASLANDIDYTSSGRTLDRMGLSGVSADRMDGWLCEGASE